MYKVITQAKSVDFGFLYDSQETFRIMMMAIFHPGKIFQMKNIPFSETGNQYLAVLQAMLTLMDKNTRIHIYGDDPELVDDLAINFLKNHGCICREIDKADFVLCLDGTLGGSFAELKSGTLPVPYANTAVFYLVNIISKYPLCDGNRLDLIAPDFRSIDTLYVDGLEEEEIIDWSLYRGDYPQGVDIFLISKDGRVAGIPRSPRFYSHEGVCMLIMAIISVITLLFIVTCLVYVGTFLYARFGINKLRKPVDGNSRAFVSVIIAAKNEEKHIAWTLNWVLNQEYDRERYEVILVNDASTDRTLAIAREFAARYPQLRIITQPVLCPYVSRKKYALEKGIEAAQGEFLLFTDADAFGSARWLRSMTGAYDNAGEVGAVCGFVCLPHRQQGSFFNHFQETEYLMLSLLGIGYGGQGFAVGNNGNNFSYRKSLYLAVGGFDGINHIKSGDDDLMLDKFTTLSDKKINYCYQQDAVVETAPVDDFGSLINQRSRWASKVFVYRRIRYALLLVSIFTFNLMLLLYPLLSLVSLPLLLLYGTGLFAKCLVDGLIIIPELKHLGRSKLAKWFLPVEVLHIPYLIYIGIRGTLQKFQWKETAAPFKSVNN